MAIAPTPVDETTVCHDCGNDKGTERGYREADLTWLVSSEAISIRTQTVEMPMAVTGLTPVVETLATSNAAQASANSS
jgi:hypothetical protein